MRKSGVVAFAFGVPSSTRTNLRIARIAMERALIEMAPIYTQRDIAIDSDFPVEYIEDDQGNPPPTLRIARGAVIWAKRLGIEELWVACASPHLLRCKRDLRYAIRESGANIVVLVCPGVWDHPEEEWYSPESTQPRVRSREAWRKRERIIELMPMFLYKWWAS